MRPRGCIAVASAAVAAVCLTPASASAASGYCSPTGDYCYAARVRGGAVRLTLLTFSFRGRVRVCVTPPAGGRRDCRTFRLRHGPHGIYGFDVRWSAHFPAHGAGTYRVRFAPRGAGGADLGPGVTFRRRR